MGSQLEEVKEVLRKVPNREAEANPVEDAFIKPFGLVDRYVRTRRAVLKGEALYNLYPAELAEKRLLGPWAFFSTTQALLATLEALVGQGAKVEASGTLADLFPHYVEKLGHRLWLPVMAVWATTIAARSSLRKRDLTAANVVRAKKANLYGYSAILLHVSWVTTIVAAVCDRVTASDPRSEVMVGALFGLGACMAWMFALLVPMGRYMFRANGYASDPPWSRFVLVGGIRLIGATFASLAAIAAIAFVAAVVHHELAQIWQAFRDGFTRGMQGQ